MRQQSGVRVPRRLAWFGMIASTIVECECAQCQQDSAHPERALHRGMNVFISRLDEAQRRWYAALESQRAAHRSPAGPDHGDGREDDPPGSRRDGCGVDGLPVRTSAAAGGRMTPHRKKIRP